MLCLLPQPIISVHDGVVRHYEALVRPVDQVLVKSIIEVAHTPGRKTVAEFVENPETLALLKSYGIDYARGYYIGKPEPAPQADQRCPSRSDILRTVSGATTLLCSIMISSASLRPNPQVDISSSTSAPLRTMRMAGS